MMKMLKMQLSTVENNLALNINMVSTLGCGKVIKMSPVDTYDGFLEQAK